MKPQVIAHALFIPQENEGALYAIGVLSLSSPNAHGFPHFRFLQRVPVDFSTGYPKVNHRWGKPNIRSPLKARWCSAKTPWGLFALPHSVRRCKESPGRFRGRGQWDAFVPRGRWGRPYSSAISARAHNAQDLAECGERLSPVRSNQHAKQHELRYIHQKMAYGLQS